MGELKKIESFRQQLAIVETIEEIKLLGDATEAYQQLMIKQQIAKKSIDEIGEFDIEVKEKEAEWLNKFYPSKVNRAYTKTEYAMPVTPKESAMVRRIKKARDETPEKVESIKEKIKKSKKSLNAKTLESELKKAEKEKQIEEQKEKILSGEISLPEGIFDIIVIDPPWPYGRKYDPDTSRSANPYPEMSIEEISKINLYSDKDSILWLWTTHKFIWDAKKLMDLWGFEYKAIFIWNKVKMGMGTWLRMQCEFCLLGIKGKPLWDIKNLRDILTIERTSHSSKPDKFYQMIDDNFISKNEFKADYFGRKEKVGWKIKK